jgi:phage shock protein C
MEPTTSFEKTTATGPAATDPFDDLWTAGPAAAPPPPAPRPRFTLRRSRAERMIGGVCGGLAESLDVDVTLLRLGLVALTVLGAGIGVVFYVAAWILAPQAGEGATAA